MTFGEELRRGNFCVPWCGPCRRWVWPPSARCGVCLGETAVRPYAGHGRVSEFSVRGDIVFCMCVFGDGFGLMGKMASPDCRVGLRVKVSRCGVDGSGPFFEFSAAD